MGVGLAVAVALDATVIRGVLLPATMRLLGDWNWWLPRGLRWLPQVSLEHTAPKPALRPAPIRRVARHYAELLVAMLAGMLILGIPAEGVLHLIGSSSSELQTDAPALAILGMALMMTIPMVWLMRHRGHSWRPCWEMAASMFLPALAVIAVMWSGVEGD